MDIKTRHYICCLQETHLKPTDTYRLKVKGWKKIFHANGDQKKAEVAILIPDKIDFEIKTVIRDKAGHYKENYKTLIKEIKDDPRSGLPRCYQILPPCTRFVPNHWPPDTAS